MEIFAFKKLVLLRQRRRPKKPTDALEVLFFKDKTWNVKPDPIGEAPSENISN